MTSKQASNIHLWQGSRVVNIGNDNFMLFKGASLALADKLGDVICCDWVVMKIFWDIWLFFIEIEHFIKITARSFWYFSVNLEIMYKTNFKTIFLEDHINFN